MAPKKTKLATKGFPVSASSFVGSQYAQLVGVTVTNFNITLDFVYVNPRNKKMGEVVSRITLPLSTGESLAETIKKTLIKHRQDKKNLN